MSNKYLEKIASLLDKEAKEKSTNSKAWRTMGRGAVGATAGSLVGGLGGATAGGLIGAGIGALKGKTKIGFGLGATTGGYLGNLAGSIKGGQVGIKSGLKKHYDTSKDGK